MRNMLKQIFISALMLGLLSQPAWSQEGLSPAGGSVNASKNGLASSKRYEKFINFNNADLVEVINLISSILKLNYIIDPAVSGTVSIHTRGEIKRDDLPSILNTLLKINNVVRVKEGNLTHFIPLKEAPNMLVYPQVGDDPDTIEVKQSFIIQVIKLKYVRASEISEIIQNYSSDNTNIFTHEKDNLMIISDIDSNVKKLMKIISLFDVDIFESAQMTVFSLKNAPAELVATELKRIFQVHDFPVNTARGIGIAFFPIERINGIIAVTSNPTLMRQTEKWIKDLDRSVSENKIGVYIYPVQNVKAEELAGVIISVFSRRKDADKEYKKNVIKDKDESADTPKVAADNSDKPSSESVPEAVADTLDSTEGAHGMVEHDINIVTDSTTNSIIVKATKKDYAVILETMQALDVFPKQVLIEVTIAEVLLDESTRFGVDWQYRQSFGSGSDTTGTASILTGAAGIGSGLAYTVSSTDKLTAALRASADDNKVNILSSPRVIASDNRPASISIGEDIPIVTSSYRTNDVSSTATTVDQTVQYRSTGIILSVIPRINESGLVQLELSQEISEMSEKSVSGIQSPVIFTRNTETVLAVSDSETVIIGGMMKQRKTHNKSGVPFLSKIPILGYFFSYTSESVVKTELMILITPRVIKNNSDIVELSRDYKKRVRNIKVELDKLTKE